MDIPESNSSQKQNPQLISEVDLLRKKAFQDLQPICVSISELAVKPQIYNDSTKELTKRLETLLNTLQFHSRQYGVINTQFADYIFFPLSHIFRRRQDVPDRVMELVLECLHALLCSAWNRGATEDLAKQLLILLTFTVEGSETPGGAPASTPGSKKEISEETRTAAIRCCYALFQSIERSGIKGKVFGSIEALPSVGHTVVTLLGVLVTAQSSDLQTICLEALEVLVCECLEVDAVVSFLPGIVSQLCKFVLPNSKFRRPFRNLAMGIKLLKKIFCRVFDDVENSNLPDAVGKSEGKNAEMRVDRTKAWLKATSGQIKMALEGIFRLRSHDKPAVRLALLELSRDLLDTCSNSLSSCIGILVETLVIFVGDKDEDISQKADNALLYAAAVNNDIKAKLVEAIHAWILSLTRVIESNDEAAKVSAVQRINAGIQLLDSLGVESETLQDLLNQNVQQSLKILSYEKGAQISQMPAYDVSTELILQDRKDVIIPRKILEFPEVLLRHQSQTDTLSSFKSLVQQLGKSPNALNIAEQQLQVATRASAPENSISLWIVVNMMRGVVGDDSLIDLLDFDMGSSALQRRVTDEMLTVSVDLLSRPSIPENATLQALSLEALSFIAKTYGSPFKNTLSETLYPVVHHLGTPHTDKYAIIALDQIAAACGYSSARELLVSNADYLLNAIALKLTMADLEPQAPLALRMIIKIAGPAIVPYLDDLVQAVFETLDSFHGYEKLTTLMFGVLEATSEEARKAIKGYDSEKEIINKRVEELRPKPISEDDFLSSLDEALKVRPDPTDADVNLEQTPQEPWGKPKKPKGVDLEEEEGDKDNIPEGSKALTELKPPPPTSAYTLLQNTSLLIPNHLTTSSSPLKLLLLNLLTLTLPPLSSREDDFLPLIHQTWDITVHTLLYAPEEDINIKIAAARTLRTMCLYAGSFVRGRVKKVWDGIDGKGALWEWSGRRGRERLRLELESLLEGMVLTGGGEEVVAGVVKLVGRERLVSGKVEGLRRVVREVGGWVI